MLHPRLLLVLGAALAASGPGSAQTLQPRESSTLQPLSAVATHRVPVPDLAAVRAEDDAREQAGEPFRYAIPELVNITPFTDGTWEDLDGDTLLWRLRVLAPGAFSINLGFGEYRMPPGGALHLYSADRTQFVRPFTMDDNEVHGELWTPVVRTQELVLELELPAARLDDLRLTLTQIGYGYRGFGAPKSSAGRSGSCNVDVICPQGDPWRLDIPSVGVISLGGGTFCTGFLVNNVREDQTPYFMTASHCGVRAGNAASLVVFWNYENSTCRTPGSAQSGQAGNGRLNQFNTGSTHRAGYGPSDFTLVELDDMPDPSFMVSFAGWSNSSADATRAVAIHHPNTQEKRISFENQPTTTTSYLGSSVPGNGTHVRVEDWDLGTTEGGSSGSPLFDQNHRVIGQLHGGFASCASQTSDWYGRFSVSWNGGGTPASQLKVWLDPDGTGAQTVDTISSAGTRGQATAYGAEVGGANIATLSTMTTPTIGQPLALDASGFSGSSTALVVVSAGRVATAFMGGALLVDLGAVLGNMPVGLVAGSGSASFGVPNDPNLTGTLAYAQAGALDAAQVQGFAFSNGLRILVGDL